MLMITFDGSVGLCHSIGGSIATIADHFIASRHHQVVVHVVVHEFGIFKNQNESKFVESIEKLTFAVIFLDALHIIAIVIG